MSRAKKILDSITQATLSEETEVISSQIESERQWDDLDNDAFDVVEMATESGHDCYVGSWVENQIRMNLIAEPRLSEGGPNLFLEVGQNPKIRYAYNGATFQHVTEMYPEFKKVARRIKASGLGGVDLTKDWKVIES